MNCQVFRATFAAQTEDAALLAHLRSCDACLDFALAVDPDVFFRAVGGDEAVPPGGVDLFVAEVMREVRVRSAETIVRPRVVPAWRRFAAAAAITLAVGGGWFASRQQFVAEAPVQQARIVRPAAVPVATVAAVSRPVIESYQSANATIVEVPTEGAGDVKLVMIFDENLPKDL